MNELAKRDKELVAIGAAIGSNCIPCIVYHCPASQMDTTGDAFRQIMLISAGAAMAANCEPCLNQVVPNLIEVNVTSYDITKAVTIGQTVKDRISGQTQKLAHETLRFSA
jgi:hypothetical protein